MGEELPAAGSLREKRLTVLLPVRNGEPHLEQWLAGVAGYADAVIALDDGSTDRTRQILEDAPLVTSVLTNPERPSYAGWDDRENRQRLVDAALVAGAGWMLFLDADERLDPDDGHTLRSLLGREFRRGFAYGFELFSMVGDGSYRSPRALWVVRLFHGDDATTPLPDARRLHFVPVPANLGRSRWLYTSLRIQHFGGSTPEARRERRAKYAEVDPDDVYDQNYGRLLHSPSVVEPWPKRRDVPVVLGRNGRHLDVLADRAEPGGVALSAVVIAQNDAATIERSLAALVDQEVEEPFEVILVDSGQDDTVEIVRRRFPSVRAVRLPEPALPGEARNAGLLMARGEFISFPGSHVWLARGSLQARLDAHDEGWPLVTGSALNGNTSSRAGWASYFLDHAARMPGRPSGSVVGPPGSCSYVTDDLRRVGGFPEKMRAGEDTVVNQALFGQGRRAAFCADASFFHASPCETLADLVRHHYTRGRGLGQILADLEDGHPFARRRIEGTRNAVRNRTRRLRHHIDRQPADVSARFRSVRWHVRAGAAAYVVGAVRELGRRGAEVRGEQPAPLPRPSSPDVPVLAIGGRPGPHPRGQLGMGGPEHAVRRLDTMVRYAAHRAEVCGALAPVVVSATATVERNGTHTLDVDRRRVARYLSAARGIDASLVLQMQPGTARLTELMDRWADFLDQPDVGVLFDLGEPCAFGEQVDELRDGFDELAARLGPSSSPGAGLYVRGVVPGDAAPAAACAHTVDLREPGSLFPHDLLTGDVSASLIVYD